jgi:CRP-like cAMP-binding protein
VKKVNPVSSKETIFDHFKQFIQLSDQLKTELESKLKQVDFKKGDLVLDADRICTESYFIQKGILRTYFIKDGKEISEFFCGSHEWVNSPRSFIQRKKDIYYIDAIEDTEALSLNVNDLVYLFDNYPEMERYSRLSMGSFFGHMMERITSIRFTTAKEKYDHFCQSYNHIYHRLPLSMVASYLGIAPETLSRIRRQK